MARRSTTNYAAQWDHIDRTEELTLPGGHKVLVQPPDLARLALEGKIPNHLIGTIERFVLGGMRELLRIAPDLATEAIADSPEPGKALKRRAELQAYIEIFCCAACLEPRFSLDGKLPGTLPVSVLSSDEQFAIWDWGVGLTAALARFRGDRAGALEPVGALPGGAGVRDEAEPVAGSDAA